MKYLFPFNTTPQTRLQSRLFGFASLFLFLFCIVLTLSPAVRLHSWDVNYRWSHWAGFAIWLTGAVFLHRVSLKKLPDCDPYLFPIAMLLSGWGLLTIYRLQSYFGLRQSLWLAASIGIFYLLLLIPNLLERLKQYKYIWLIFGLLLMAWPTILNLVIGGQNQNVRLKFGFVFFQPSEPFKLLLIIFLAAYLSERLLKQINLIKLITPTLILVAAASGILLAQRDLGTASIMIMLYFLITYLASGNRTFLISALFILFLAVLAGYFIFDVIQLRVNSWLNPWDDAGGTSYQLVQSLISLASGGVLGKGIGIGDPHIIPVAHSDFIFSAIAEEMGLMGSSGLIFLIVLLTSRGLLTALKAKNNYQRFLSAGITIYISIQSILIIGGNIRFLPLTGVPLPFVAYGGSSLLTSFLGLLVLCLVSSQSSEKPMVLQNPNPLRLIAAILLLCFAGLAMTNGWWAVVRSNNLTNRIDNPRRTIADFYVKRGNILDRNNESLAYTHGESGSYQRYLTQTALSPVLGYNDYYYGQAGLEFSLDEYLRGVKGNPSSSLWYHFILYGQPPEGLDVRISIDSQTQKLADELLPDEPSTLILLDADSGEILAMASHPYVDPQTLEENWGSWNQDKDAPFLNRATLGQYTIGSISSTFILPEILAEKGKLPQSPDFLDYSIGSNVYDCSLPAEVEEGWEKIISSGCPGAAIQLAKQISVDEIEEIYAQHGFAETPQISLPAAEAADIQVEEQTDLIFETHYVSPLQMVRAAAVFSNGGVMPQAVLEMAVNTPNQGWVILSETEETQLYSEEEIDAALDYLNNFDPLIWEVSANSYTEESTISWFIGGTTSEWQGSPLAIVVVLEQDDAERAREIGVEILQKTMNQ